jgi:predicted nucleic acid-binding protein
VTPEKVDRLVSEIVSRAALVHIVPPTLALPRDPKDEWLIDLAVAGGAAFIVTWNERHLTYLMKRDTPEGIEFHRRFPHLRIVSPPDFLAAIRSPDR